MVEKFLQEYERKILEEAKTLTTESLPVLTEELFALYEKTGNRLEYEKVYFQRRKHLSVAAIAGGDIEKTLLDICKETTWALPAHVNRQIEGWENTIDLFAAETAFYLAEISMKHRASLQPDTLRMVQQEVLRRVLLPFAKSKRPYAFWEQCDMNWNAVCNGAIGCGALWLLQDDEALETGFDLVTDVVDVSAMLRNIIQRVTENLPYYLNGFSKDGVCPEGLSYYTYGLTFYFAFADLLQKFTGSDGGLLENPRLSAIATFLQKCYLPGGYTLSFSDGNIREKFRIGLQSFMAMHFE
ncbi:MAG: heparinase, partial [Agathobacter sp.]